MRLRNLMLILVGLGATLAVACSGAQTRSEATEPETAATAGEGAEASALANPSESEVEAPPGDETAEATSDDAQVDAEASDGEVLALGSAALGAEVYAKCQGCHGTKEAPGRAPNLFAAAWSGEEQLAALGVIREGRGKMPAFGERLSQEELADLMAHLVESQR